MNPQNQNPATNDEVSVIPSNSVAPTSITSRLEALEQRVKELEGRTRTRNKEEAMKPIRMNPIRLEALEAWQAAAITVLDDLLSRNAALEKRVTQLESHIHMVDFDQPEGNETTLPHIEGFDNEGHEIWKPLE
jgi:hypothetical protein